MRILEVKYNDGRVQIAYEKKSSVSDDYDKLSIDSAEPPKPMFNKVLQSLAPFVCDICDWPEKHVETIKVLSVHFKYAGAKMTMGANITATKKVSRTPSPLIVNTPFLSSEAKDKAGVTPHLPKDVVQILRSLINEAEDYLAGKRAQIKLGEETKNEQ